MKYEITKNEAFNSFEILFDSKPSEEVREALKTLRYRWHKVKGVWYGYGDENTVREAIENATKGVKVAKVTKTTTKTEKVNKYGVEVGDVFYLNWGWEQTNVDFFQVVALVGETSVKVKHVNPEIVNTDGQGFMCANYTYNITKEPMRVDTCNVFIKDSEHGDTKRVNVCGDVPYIRIGSSNHMASRIPFGLRKEYVSWYA